jgi:hypothetical protein
MGLKLANGGAVPHLPFGFLLKPFKGKNLSGLCQNIRPAKNLKV